MVEWLNSAIDTPAVSSGLGVRVSRPRDGVGRPGGGQPGGHPHVAPMWNVFLAARFHQSPPQPRIHNPLYECAPPRHFSQPCSPIARTVARGRKSPAGPVGAILLHCRRSPAKCFRQPLFLIAFAILRLLTWSRPVTGPLPPWRQLQ